MIQTILIIINGTKIFIQTHIPNIILLKILSSVTRYYYIIHIYVIIYNIYIYNIIYDVCRDTVGSRLVNKKETSTRLWRRIPFEENIILYAKAPRGTRVWLFLRVVHWSQPPSPPSYSIDDAAAARVAAKHCASVLQPSARPRTRFDDDYDDTKTKTKNNNNNNNICTYIIRTRQRYPVSYCVPRFFGK